MCEQDETILVFRIDEQQGTRTSKHKETSMRSNSMSSESSQEEVLPSNRSNPQKSSLVHYQVLKPDFSQVKFDRMSLRIEGSSIDFENQ